MVKRVLHILAFLFITCHINAQNSVGVNTDAPNPNAALDIHPVGGQVQGVLIPRLSTADITGMSLGSEDNGLMVFDAELGYLLIWFEGFWMPLATDGPASVITDGITIFGDGDATPLSVNVGTGSEQIVQLDPSGFLPALDASQLFNLPPSSVNVDGTTVLGDGDGSPLAVNVGTGADQVVQLDASSRLPAVDGSQLVNLPAATVNVDGTTITGDGNALNLAVNAGTGANQIVQLDASSRLPAVDGSLLTNLPTTPVNVDGTTIIGDGDALNLAVNSGTGADQIVQLDASSRLPAVDGSLLTNLPTTPVNVDGTTITGDGDALNLAVNAGTGADQIVQLDASSRLPAVDGSLLTNLPTTPVNVDGTTITGDGDGVNLAVNAGTGADQIVQLDASSRLPGVDGSLLTNLPTTPVNVDGTTITGDGDGVNLAVNAGTGADQIVQLDASSRLPGVDGSLLTNLPTTPVNVDGTTITGDGDGVNLAVNAGTGADQIVQLDASSRLPGVDGSLLTNLPTTPVNVDGTTITGDGDGVNLAVNAGTGADQIVQLDASSRLPAVDGSQLTNLPTTATSGSGITVAGSNVNLGGSMTANADITTNGFEFTIIRGSPSNAATMHVYNNNGGIGTGGNILLEGQNSATSAAVLGKIETRMTNASSGAESGELVLSVVTSGALTEGLRIDDIGELNANEYKYIGTKTRYYGIPPVAFGLTQTAAADNELQANFGNSVIVSSAAETSGAQISAPVHLPDGAQIVSVEVMGRNTTAIPATLHFVGKSYSTATTFDDTGTIPVATSGISTFNISLGGTRIIDNNSNNYFIYIELPTTAGNLADISGARITYTVTSAD